MRFILTRHGETEENKRGIIQGQLPGKLSDRGKEQAKKVALRLQHETIDYIYTSDLARASDTAKEIAVYHPHVPLILVPELREMNLGEFQGKKAPALGWDLHSQTPLVQLKKGEDLHRLYHRAVTFIHGLLKRYPPETTILLVGHNGINRALIAVLTGKRAEDIRSMENQKNTSICILEVDKQKNHTIHAFNCTTHLG